MKKRFEIVIVGGGITGLTVAAQLARLECAIVIVLRK